MTKQTIYITGTHCPACKKLIERRISTIANVSGVEVNFETGETVIMSDRKIEGHEIDKVLEGMPYAQKD